MQQLKLFFLDMIERAASTAGQQFLVIAFAGGLGALTNVPWLGAVDSAGFAALLSILTSLGTSALVLPAWADLPLRVGKTFLQSLLATLTVGHYDLVSAPWRTAVLVALSAAGSALVKGYVAGGRDPATGPSLLSSNTLMAIDPASRLEPMVADPFFDGPDVLAATPDPSGRHLNAGP